LPRQADLLAWVARMRRIDRASADIVERGGFEAETILAQMIHRSMTGQ
jgi:hypothetical protein